VAHAVDSLLNFETVKYFGAEDREASATRAAITAYSERGDQVGQLAGVAQHRSGADHQRDDGIRRMAWSRWGWSQARFTRATWCSCRHLLLQLFRPLDLLGMVYRTIRQGVIDMAQMFHLIDTGAEVEDVPGAGAGGRPGLGAPSTMSFRL
jgi:ATP-binding cassette, subfamily B, heavy metal transporter